MLYLSIYIKALCLCIILASCSSINEKLGLKDDNPYEELAEEMLADAIQYETGFKPDIDFTPSSLEKK